MGRYMPLGGHHQDPAEAAIGQALRSQQEGGEEEKEEEEEKEDQDDDDDEDEEEKQEDEHDLRGWPRDAPI